MKKYTPFVFVALLALSGLCVFPNRAAASVYSYARALTVDHTKVPNTDQSYFPVLVSGTYSYLATIANGGKVQNANGYDIGFFSDSACSTKLNWETELYTASNGKVIYWVQIPTLSHTADTVFYMCYGAHSITTDQSNKTATWNDGGNNYFKGVWHLDDAASPAKDSTANADSASQTGTPTFSATAQVGTGVSLSGSGQYLSGSDAGFASGASTRTVTLWMKTPVNTAQQVMFSYGTAVNGEASGVYLGTSGELHFEGWGLGANDLTTTLTPSTNAWHFVAAAYDGANGIIYLDNQTAQSGAVTLNTVPGGSVFIGDNLQSFPAGFDGTIDEVEFSNTLRSADWIATEYNNQSSPSTFYSVGSEQTVSFTSSTGRVIRLIGHVKLIGGVRLGGSSPISATYIRVYLTSGTTWTVPVDWNSASNTIEVIGGGGSGAAGSTNNGGGGGGAYSEISNLSLTPGVSVGYSVGAGGASVSGTSAGNAGGDTWFCNLASNCASIADTAVVVGAKGGSGAPTGGSGGAGGVGTSGVGTTKNSGGAGSGDSNTGGGGGGAAGPSGNGAAGGTVTGGNDGSAGGGGADNGSAGGSVSGSTNNGSAGGNNSGASGGGTGGTSGTPNGGAGSTGGGGGGGFGDGAGTGGTGGAGGKGTEWGSYGAGGGGGGGGFSGSAATGGMGGLYGGGGGGGYTSPGAGAQGIIVITYTLK